MPFYKKSYNKQQGVYYPRAVVQGKPVETETIAKDLAKISTVSNSDVQAVLGDIAGVMHTRMAQGKSVHIKGLGYFRYVLDTVGVDTLEDFDFEKQVKAVRVEFIPERTRLAPCGRSLHAGRCGNIARRHAAADADRRHRGQRRHPRHRGQPVERQ